MLGAYIYIYIYVCVCVRARAPTSLLKNKYKIHFY